MQMICSTKLQIKKICSLRKILSLIKNKLIVSKILLKKKKRKQLKSCFTCRCYSDSISSSSVIRERRLVLWHFNYFRRVSREIRDHKARNRGKFLIPPLLSWILISRTSKCRWVGKHDYKDFEGEQIEGCRTSVKLWYMYKVDGSLNKRFREL